MKPFVVASLTILANLSMLVFDNASFAEAQATVANPTISWIGTPVVTGSVIENATDISTNNEVAYRARFDEADWEGDIQARIINSKGQIDDQLAPKSWISPAYRLSRVNWNTDRKIFTSDGKNGIPFRWNRLSSAERAALGDGDLGRKVLNYIRGDQSNEAPRGLKFRTRQGLLGDFVHSNIYFWKYDASRHEPARIYAGANDGMLHAFDAETGAEVFAYIPSIVIKNLSSLTKRNYVHTYFVDGQISIARIDEQGTISTLLVGGLGAGGSGLYCLDVSDPVVSEEDNARKMVRWEVEAKGVFRNLGEIHGRIKLARLANGQAVAITGNGYNGGNQNVASLFIIDLKTGHKIAEILAGTSDSGKPDGLSSPTLLDSDGDGFVDVAYAGDLLGNLWKFNLNKLTANKLFHTDAGAPITVEPTISDHPEGGFIITFGTGIANNESDIYQNTHNFIYGIWDGAPRGNHELLSQVLSNQITYKGNTYRSISTRKPNWTDGHDRGWKVELPSGERLVGHTPFIHGDRFYFTTTNPTLSPAVNWLNELDYKTGGFSGCSIFDLDGNGVFCKGNQASSGDRLKGGRSAISVHLKDGQISQPLLVQVKNQSFLTTVYNWNSGNPTASLLDVVPPQVKVPKVGAGVSGGHFDFDIYSNSGSSYSNNKHVHEYDDIYGVIGVNMLSPSTSEFDFKPNLVKNKSKKFKVLILNQYLNPAAYVAIGSAKYESVITWGNLAGDPESSELTNGHRTVSTAEKVLSGLPDYTLKTIKSLTFALPTDAFKSKNWWEHGTMEKRAGLIPTQTGCVNKVGSDGSTQTGANGERFDGALTFQIIDADTPAKALELNNPRDVRYGWRVKKQYFLDYVIGEYTTFWHHPNGACYGDSGWSDSPPMDYNNSAGGHATRGNDPVAADFNGGDGYEDAKVISDSTKTNVINGVTITTQTIKYSDGSVYKLVKEYRQDGSVWAQQTMPNGKVNPQQCIQNCDVSGFVAPPDVPYEDNSALQQPVHRENWAEVFQ